MGICTLYQWCDSYAGTLGGHSRYVGANLFWSVRKRHETPRIPIRTSYKGELQMWPWMLLLSSPPLRPLRGLRFGLGDPSLDWCLLALLFLSAQRLYNTQEPGNDYFDSSFTVVCSICRASHRMLWVRYLWVSHVTYEIKWSLNIVSYYYSVAVLWDFLDVIEMKMLSRHKTHHIL